METPTPKPRRQKPYAFLDLEFLIQEAPGLLGEKSNHGGFESAVKGGGPGASVASSDEHHGHLIDRLPHVAKARRLLRIWQTLDGHTQAVLLSYYTPRVRWPEGIEDQIGPEMASVAMGYPPDVDPGRWSWSRIRLDLNSYGCLPVATEPKTAGSEATSAPRGSMPGTGQFPAARRWSRFRLDSDPMDGRAFSVGRGALGLPV